MMFKIFLKISDSPCLNVLNVDIITVSWSKRALELLVVYRGRWLGKYSPVLV